MYTFTTIPIAGLKVSSTVAKQGTEHHKAYAEEGVTPVTQNTLNVYVSGSFSITSGTWAQTVGPGDCSLDLTIPQYEKDELVIERVESAWGSRFCVSCDSDWQRTEFILAADETLTVPTDSLLVLLTGEVLVGDVGMKGASYRSAPHGAQITAETAARGVLCHVAPSS